MAQRVPVDVTPGGAAGLVEAETQAGNGVDGGLVAVDAPGTGEA